MLNWASKLLVRWRCSDCQTVFTSLENPDTWGLRGIEVLCPHCKKLLSELMDHPEVLRGLSKSHELFEF